MILPFTITGGVLTLDEGAGTKDGLCVVDGGAGVVRDATGSRSVPCASLRAVVVGLVERDVQVRIGRSAYEMRRKTVPCVLLLPSGVGEQLRALVDGIERGQPLPGFSSYAAAAAIDAEATHFCRTGTLNAARQTAKAVAKLAGLPVVELDSDGYLVHPAGQLDLSLRDELRRRPPTPAPGPPPGGLTQLHGDAGLELAFAVAAPPRGTWLAMAAGAGLVGLLLAAMDPVPAVIAFLIAVGLGIYGFGLRARARTSIFIGKSEVRLRRPPSPGSEADERGELDEQVLPIDRIERVRAVDAELVLVTHEDELRCALPSEADAAWAKHAVETEIAKNAGGAAFR